MTEEVEISYMGEVKNPEGSIMLSGNLYRMILDLIQIDGLHPTDCIFHLSPEQMQINMVDYHSTCLISLILPQEAFIDYHVKEGCEVKMIDLTPERQWITDDDDVTISWTAEERYKSVSGMMYRTIGTYVESATKGTASYFELDVPFDPDVKNLFCPSSDKFVTLRNLYTVMDHQVTTTVLAEPFLRELETMWEPYYTTSILFVAEAGAGTLQLYATKDDPSRWLRRSDIETQEQIYSSGVEKADLVGSTINQDKMTPFLKIWDPDTLIELTIGENYPIRARVTGIDNCPGAMAVIYIAPKVEELQVKEKR